MAPVMVSAFGTVGVGLFSGLFSAPAWQTCLLGAGGWVLAAGRPPLPPSWWGTGAGSVKPGARFSGFPGLARDQARGQRWARLLRRAAQGVPPEAPSVLEGEDSPTKNAGRHRDGGARARTGAGAARQA